MREFADFCRAIGLRVGRVPADNRWHRYNTEAHPRKKNGAAKLSADQRIGWAIDFATMSEHATWRPDRAIQPERYDPERMRKMREAARRQRREAMAATRAAREFWQACQPLRNGHPYLASHQLDMRGCHGLRQDADGWMVVPMLRNDAVVSVQRISPSGQKLFWPKAPTKNTSYTIDRPNASLTVVCEGLATGLAIFACVPTSRVIVAFTAGGLSHAVDLIPTGLATIASDDDRATEARTGRNPGLIAAREAAERVQCGVAVPGDMPDGLTDWCDWRMWRVRERLEAWNRRPHEQESTIRRGVDAEIAAEIHRSAKFAVRT